MRRLTHLEHEPAGARASDADLVHRVGASTGECGVVHARHPITHRGRDRLVSAAIVQRGKGAPEVGADRPRVGGERFRRGIVHRGDGAVREDADDPGAKRAEHIEPVSGKQRVRLRRAIGSLRFHVRRIQSSPFLLHRCRAEWCCPRRARSRLCENAGE
jgi:hypothetical protein